MIGGFLNNNSLNIDVNLDERHLIYYILSAQEYMSPPFPMPKDGFFGNFNVLSPIEVMDALKYLPDDTQAQKIIVLGHTHHGTTKKFDCGKTYRTRLMDIKHYKSKPFSFPIGLPFPAKDIDTEMNRCVIPDAVLDPILCRKMLDHDMKLSDVINCTIEIAEYAVRSNINNLNYIIDCHVSQSIRKYISTLDLKSKQFKMRPSFYKEKPLKFQDKHPDAVIMVNNILAKKDKYNDNNSYLFDDLYICKEIFIEWIKQYQKLPFNCKYKLNSIAYADEFHRKNDEWTHHINEWSQNRLNITDACCIQSSNDLRQLYLDCKPMFLFMHELGFKLCLHQQYYWRKGTDIKITINKFHENCDYLSLLMVPKNFDYEKEHADDEPPNNKIIDEE